MHFIIPDLGSSTYQILPLWLLHSSPTSPLTPQSPSPHPSPHLPSPNPLMHINPCRPKKSSVSQRGKCSAAQVAACDSGGGRRRSSYQQNSARTADTAQDFTTVKSGSFGQVGRRPHSWMEVRGVKVSPDSIISDSHKAQLSKGFVGSTGQKSARRP